MSMVREGDEGSLYAVLAVAAPAARPGVTGPDTTFTKSIETVDNDRATALLDGVP